MTSFNEKLFYELLKYKIFVNKNFNKNLRTYDLRVYIELENQLNYIQDFIVWNKSFSKYFKLFTKFKNKLISGNLFMEIFLNYIMLIET